MKQSYERRERKCNEIREAVDVENQQELMWIDLIWEGPWMLINNES